MGARGPKADPLQAAKGFPGRRRGKAASAAKEAARVADLLAPVDGAAALPTFLADEKYAAAAAVWRKLAPELKRTHRLPSESEFNLMRLCVYVQEWLTATEDLHSRGFVQSVETVVGGKMERRRPAVFDRQQAHQNIMELSARFGLTPSDMYGLFKDQTVVATRSTGLFGDDRPAPPEEAPAPSGRVGSFARMRSEPPPSKPN